MYAKHSVNMKIRGTLPFLKQPVPILLTLPFLWEKCESHFLGFWRSSKNQLPFTKRGRKVIYIYIYIYIYVYIYIYIYIHTHTHTHTHTHIYIYIHIYVILKTMCPPGYHHNGFVAVHALGHMMCSYTLLLVPMNQRVLNK